MSARSPLVRALPCIACEIEGVAINGIDMIHWNEAGLVTNFKVMVRPLKAINMLHQQMGAVLAKKA